MLINEKDLLVGHRVVTGMSFLGLVDLIATLYDYKWTRWDGNGEEPTRRDELETLLKDIREINTHRNSLVHSYWFDDDQLGDETALRYKFRSRGGKWREDEIQATPDEIEQLAGNADDLVGRLGVFAEPEIGHFFGPAEEQT